MKTFWITLLLIFIKLSASGDPSLAIHYRSLSVGQKAGFELSENVSKVLKQLDIADSACHFDFVAEKVVPYSPGQSVIVIPKIVEKDEDIFVCDFYLVMINNTTGSIINKYHDPEALVSDAIRIQSISIDFAPFKLSATTRAFGVRVMYEGDSRPYPYEREEISLFIPKGDELLNILKNYTISSITGEWDTNCEGQFVSEKKVLIMSKNTTNDYCDIVVKNKITTTTNTFVNNECKDTDSITHATSILKFDTREYK